MDDEMMKDKKKSEEKAEKQRKELLDLIDKRHQVTEKRAEEEREALK